MNRRRRKEKKKEKEIKEKKKKWGGKCEKMLENFQKFQESIWSWKSIPEAKKLIRHRYQKV